MLLAPGFGHVAQMSGLQNFFGHGQASWREYSPLITYPINAFGSSENNLVAITATEYDECYGDMPITYHTSMLVLIVVGLFCTAYLTVPLALNFRKHSSESKVSGVFAPHCLLIWWYAG